MKRLFKVLAVFLVLLVLSVAAAAIAIKVFFSPEKVRSLVVKKAEQALNRKVDIAGVGLGIFSGLRLDGVRISERPDFSKGAFLEAKAFTFRFRWRPLLQRRLVASELTLEGLDVTVRQYKDGTTNLPGVAATTGAAKGTATTTTSPPQPSSREREEGVAIAAITVETIRLKDAKVRHIDEKAHTETVVKVPLASVKGFTLDGAFPFSARVEASYTAGKDSRTVTVDAEGTVDLAAGDPKKLAADLTKLTVATKEATVTGTLKFRDSKSPKAEFRLGLGAVALDGKVSVTGLDAASPTVDFDVRSNTFDLKELAPYVSTGTKLPAGQLSLAVSGIKRADDLELRRASVVFGDAQASLSGTVSRLSSPDPALKLALNTGVISFASFASYLPDITNLTGKAKLTSSVGGTVNAPKVAGSLELTGAGAEYMKQKLEGLTGTVRFSESEVELPRLTGKVNGGDLVLKFSAKDPKAPVVTVNGSLTVLDAGALEALMAAAPGDGSTSLTTGASTPAPPAPPYTGPVARTSGAFTIDRITHPNFTSAKASFDWDLNGVTPELKLLTGKAALRIGAGRAVKLLDMARQKGGLSRAMVMPLELIGKARGKIPGLNVPDMNDLKFDRIEGDYAFKQGIMTMQPSLIDGPDIQSQTRGTVDLVKMTVDLKSQVAASGVGSMTLNITGPADDPKITPDLTRAKEELKEKGQKILKEQGQKLLKGLFNK